MLNYFYFSLIFSVNWSTLMLQKLHEAIAKLQKLRSGNSDSVLCPSTTKESFIIVRLKVKIIHRFLEKWFLCKNLFQFLSFLVWPIFSSSQLSEPCTTSSLTFTILELVLGYLKNWVWIPKNWFLVPNSLEIHEISAIEMYFDLIQISWNPKRHFLGFNLGIRIPYGNLYHKRNWSRQA